METVLLRAQYVLTIGGALCVIMLFFVLVSLMRLMRKSNRLMREIRMTYMTITQTIFSPLRMLQQWFADDDDDEF